MSTKIEAAPLTLEQAPETASATSTTGLVWLVYGLFFVWGGATSLNDILIPKLKSLFALFCRWRRPVVSRGGR